jgi:predicted lipid-binding transport protein (Tim44 family)
MTKLFTMFFVALIGFGLTIHDADARRLGGASSIGKQRQMSPAPQQQAQAPAAAPATGTPATPAPSGASKWLGPLAGLAAGGLLASMFMGGGLGNILMILALVAGVFFIFRMLRRPQPQPVQYAGSSERTVVDMPVTGGATATGAAAVPVSSSTRPAWFEDEAFVREAKKHFIRLQDANDRGDLNDIREFVTPEMYAEISLQIQERGGKLNKTDVVTLSADIADVVTDGDLVIASVRYSGMIREEANAPAEAFSEIWHVQKSQSQPNAAWFIAGIQQA